MTHLDTLSYTKCHSWTHFHTQSVTAGHTSIHKVSQLDTLPYTKCHNWTHFHTQSVTAGHTFIHKVLQLTYDIPAIYVTSRITHKFTVEIKLWHYITKRRTRSNGKTVPTASPYTPLPAPLDKQREFPDGRSIDFNICSTSHSTVVPRRDNFICSIPFHFIYFIYADSIVRNGWVHLPVEETGRSDHLSLT